MWPLLTLMGLASELQVDSSTYGLDSPVQDTVMCGFKQDVLLILTQAHSVYRSDNSGFSWKQLKSLLMREGRANADSPRTIGEVVSLQVSPVDKHLLVMLGSKGINWFSDDCGNTIWALNYGKPIYSFQFHPIQRDWGLAGSWTLCEALETDTCYRYKELYVTKDLGLEWSFVASYVVQFSWAQSQMDDPVQSLFPLNRIYVIYAKDGQGHQTEDWIHSVDLVRSDDYFQSPAVTLVPGGTAFQQAGHYLFASLQDANTWQILVSAYPHMDDFQHIELPISNALERDFVVLDSSEGAVFLHLKAVEEEERYGHVFVSDGLGRRYALSLLRNGKGEEGRCDFGKVAGLEGIYIANVYERWDGPQKSVKNSQKSPHFPSQKQQTVISFDKGGIWQPLSAPYLDSQGTKFTCEDLPCSLHLHSFSSSRFSPVYSSPAALGLLIGTGNIGPFLSNDEDEVSTFISRDAGLTWYEAFKGSFIYEIGDHGAILVLIQDTTLTDTMLYSWDEGLTWTSQVIADSPFNAHQILVEASATSQRFVVIGTRKGKGVAIGLDFSSLSKPQCQGSTDIENLESNYEWWSPNDGRTGSKCLMGRTMSFSRRKQERDCYNGEQFERAETKEACICEAADFECDVGYMRHGNSPCEPIPGYPFGMETCEAGQNYKDVSSGYRKIAGNSCEKGISAQYEPIRTPCSLSPSHTALIPTLLLFLLLLGVFFWRFQALKALWFGTHKTFRLSLTP